MMLMFMLISPAVMGGIVLRLIECGVYFRIYQIKLFRYLKANEKLNYVRCDIAEIFFFCYGKSVNKFLQE